MNNNNSMIAKINFDRAVVLITGGTGSFGNALIELLISMEIKQIRVFSRDELKQEEMRIKYADHRIKFYIGDVRDRDSIESAMQGVHFVFHAAALKQVPSCDFFPIEAVSTNIMGSSNVINAAIKCGVRRLVCLSTDKAVYPVNAMGMTKALMEKVTLAAARTVQKGGTVLSAVRYGNVMCSRGSVIPLFIKQITAGKPITITLPEMTRFLLPLPDAVELVRFAFENAQQGDLFIKKAPACTVESLAEALKDIFSSNVPIQVIGKRHGEKTYETLATTEELNNAEEFDQYFRIPMDSRDLNYSSYVSEGVPCSKFFDDYHSDNTERLELTSIKKLLLQLPEVQKYLKAFLASGKAE
ncbi:polysaccharide biosynthesis protein [Candidatus Puniceispirillum sp.]|nr:polysaccharide biosynthesis protein [Candidatus Puniceispirillum sp.]